MREKRDFELKIITRDKEGDYLLIRGSTHEEDITIMDIYIPDDRTSKYMKQKWIKLKKEMDKSTILLGDFKMSLTTIDRTTGDKISKIWKN